MDLLRHVSSGNINFSLLIYGLIFTRIFVAITLTPYLATRPVPNQVKAAAGVVISLFIYPILAPTLSESLLPADTAMIGLIFLKEAFFGMLMGLINAFVFYGIQSAGSMIDNQRYVANARVFNPAMGAQTSIFGSYLYQLSIALFLVLGGHRLFLSALIESFQKVPLFSVPTLQPGITPLLDFMFHLTADTLIICLQLSAPVLIAIFIADLLLGITNRIAPMVNVFEMGFNIKGFVGVLLVYFSLPILVFQSKVWFQVMANNFKYLSDIFLRI